MKKTLMLTGLIALTGAAMALSGCASTSCPMKGSKDKMMGTACCGCGATSKADCKCPSGACSMKEQM